jgi:hypothetical protein
MPLLKGSQNIRKNIKELTTGPVGSARRKAINTLAKKWGISKKEAKFRQALIIAKEQVKK